LKIATQVELLNNTRRFKKIEKIKSKKIIKGEGEKTRTVYNKNS
jgi:hypothetical protein